MKGLPTMHETKDHKNVWVDIPHMKSLPTIYETKDQ
jgi:hypothetical protein